MAASRIVPRRIAFDFSDVPRHWFYGSASTTHAANGLNLLFPEGERFFIRSVRHYLPRIEDPTLRKRVSGFFAQEALHGCAHDEVSELLERQGYRIRLFLRGYRWLAFEVIEPVAPAALRLSVTVALEHLTASLGETALTDLHLDGAHPAMRELLLWHSAEEIEHKSVAFDVYQAVDGRYWLRALGMVIAVTGLLAFGGFATRMLLRQDGVGRAQLRRERREAAERGQHRDYVRLALSTYFRRGFHPDQVANDHLAVSWFESRGLEVA